MILQGNDVIIFADGMAMAASKSCSITVKGDTIEISSPTQGQFKEYIASRKEWDLTTTHLVKYSSDTDTPLKEMVLRVGQAYTIKVQTRPLAGDTLTGKAICTQCKITATRGNLLQGSFSFQGSGPLE